MHDRTRCAFCKRKIPQTSTGNDILHHTTPKCLIKKAWLTDKTIPNKTKELLGKSRIPLCPRCHKVYHNLIRHLIQLIKDSQVPDTPPDEFIHILRSIDAKYGVHPWKWSTDE